ncbi:SFM domain-containing protein, partial [Haematococcus lacustris]
RPESVKATASGYQASLTFAQTAKYLEPLFERLKHRALHEELRAGLWMMVTGMRDRNYLYANDLYLRLAIGNAPWPIGVTSVGIHERSAREKISHVMNQSGQAHIMNDEATRKYLQAMKRLISVVQRMYPTDPSRSADFETTTDLGRGVAGAGSTKLALLAAEARGESTASLGLPSAPHFMDDNKVAVPQKWKHILAKAQGDITQAHSNNEKAAGEQQPAPVQ